jgi:hypothetical protein
MKNGDRHARSARLAGRDCARARQQARELAQVDDHGRDLVSQPGRGSRFALADWLWVLDHARYVPSS